MEKEIINSERVKIESRFIFLLMNYRSSVSDFIESKTPIDVFIYEHKIIVNAIIDCFLNHNSLLTRESFEEHLNKNKIIKEKILLKSSFNRCFSSVENVNNYHVLFGKIIENFAHSKFLQSLDSFNKRRKNGEDLFSLIKEFEYDLADILDGKHSLNKKAMRYVDIKDLGEEAYNNIKGIRSGEIKLKPILYSGIKEIDETMYVGFEEGTLTLFVAEVGTFKSAIMLNIALNVWEKGEDVLFVPLEMTPDQIMRRIYSRQAKIDSNYLVAKINKMSGEDEDKIKKSLCDIKSSDSRFIVLESYGRTTVSSIKNIIERNLAVFSPRLVVIDYMANLVSDTNRYGREDLEIGDMLKSLREIGKEHNFAIVSAAQLGKEALKKVRKHGRSSKDRPINTEDIRGSHEYAADADFIYAMIKNSSQPNELLDLFCVKSRHGKTYFGNDGKVKASLKVCPPFGLIESADSDSFEKVGHDDELFDFVDDSENERTDIIRKDSLFDEEKVWEIDLGREYVDGEEDIEEMDITDKDNSGEVTEDDLDKFKDLDTNNKNDKVDEFDSSFFD